MPGQDNDGLATLNQLHGAVANALGDSRPGGIDPKKPNPSDGSQASSRDQPLALTDIDLVLRQVAGQSSMAMPSPL